MVESQRLASPATHAAHTLFDELIALGLRDIVVCPGSRSQALALAAAAESRADRVRLHVRIDERVAGFTALGLSRETGIPTAIVVTSGTGVANLAPAVWEAHHSAVPLLLLTADRPPELRSIGANQATVQPGAFAEFVRAEWDAPTPTVCDDAEGLPDVRQLARDAFAAATATRSVSDEGATPTPGPVHLNLPFRDPLAGDAPAWFRDRVAPEVVLAPVVEPRIVVEVEHGLRTVVVAGAGAGAEAEQISHEGSWPLIAEIVSGARFGRLLVHGYRTLLNDPDLGARIERVIVVGHPTLSREVSRLLSTPDIEVIAVRSGGVALNLNGETTQVDAISVVNGAADREWLGEWMIASRELIVDLSTPAPNTDQLVSQNIKERRAAIDAELAAVRAPVTREILADAVWRATWPHDRLVFGSSRLVRVADTVLGGKKVPVHANRGLAGIDGTIATATGIAIASQAEGARGITRVLMGDLTFLHDVGALLLPEGEAEPRVQIIVGNDGGGTIFDTLEVAKLASDEDMRRVQYTPHTVNLEHIAAAYGWEYHRVSTRSALDQVLTTHSAARQIIEVTLPR